jgi:hypothetical protein
MAAQFSSSTQSWQQAEASLVAAIEGSCTMYGSADSSVIPPWLIKFEGAQAMDCVVLVDVVAVVSRG